MKSTQKAIDRLSGIVLLLILIVIITAEAMINTTAGTLFLIMCLGICLLLVRIIDALQQEIEREKKIAKRVRYEQRLGQKCKKDVA